MSENQNISQRLRMLAARRGWTQSRMAEALGYSRNYISMVIRGRTPSPKFIHALELLESSPIGKNLTSEQLAEAAARIEKEESARVEEAAPGYGLIEKSLELQQSGTAEQITAAEVVIDAFLARPKKASKGAIELIRRESEPPESPQKKIRNR